MFSELVEGSEDMTDSRAGNFQQPATTQLNKVLFANQIDSASHDLRLSLLDKQSHKICKQLVVLSDF